MHFLSLTFDMSSMLYSKYNIEIWNVHIIAFCFYSKFVQCPNFYGIGFVCFGQI